MQGVRIRDAQGKVVLEPTDSTTSIIGKMIVPAGSPGNTPITRTITAPAGVDFTVNSPFVFLLGCRKSHDRQFNIRGNLVHQGYTREFNYPYVPVLYGVLNVTKSSYLLYATPPIGANIREPLEIYYGYS